MRNRYLEVITTYWRWQSAQWLVICLGWIYCTISSPNDGSWPDAVWLAMTFIFYATIAIGLNGHLATMLAPPRGRLIPGLLAPHLIVAGAIVALVTIVLPLCAFWTLYFFDGPLFEMLAATVSAFSISSLFFHLIAGHRRLWFILSAAVWILPWVLIALMMPVERRWSPTRSVELACFAASAVCLAIVALRFARVRFDERLVAFSLYWAGARKRSVPATTPNADFEPLTQPVWIPRSARLRSFSRHPAVADENLFQRAIHWDAAWRTLQAGVAGGVLSGASLLVFTGIFTSEFRPMWVIAAGPLLLFLALYPPDRVLTLAHRRIWTNEFLRPYPRHQQVATTFFALMASSFVGPALMIAILLPGARIVTGEWQITPNALCWLAVFVCLAPVIWGFRAMNWRPGMRRFDLVLAIVVSAVVSADVAAAVPRFGALMFILASLAVGTIAVGRAYQSWQEQDIE